MDLRKIAPLAWPNKGQLKSLDSQSRHDPSRLNLRDVVGHREKYNRLAKYRKRQKAAKKIGI